MDVVRCVLFSLFTLDKTPLTIYVKNIHDRHYIAHALGIRQICMVKHNAENGIGRENISSSAYTPHPE